MTRDTQIEAIWTLDEGPLESQSQAAALFAAVGEVVDIEPARYDLNRRGQWRPYSGPGLMVDVLTQRTQLVTIREERGVDEGGVEVALATGKYGEPPQAIARWRQQWPPKPRTLRRWEQAAVSAFDGQELRSFVLRVDDAVCLAATTDRRLDDRMRELVDGEQRAFAAGKVRGWSSLEDR